MSGNFALSIQGLAVQAGDRYVTSAPREAGLPLLLDVTSLIIPGIDPYVYRLPALTVNRGDLIMVSDSPISVRYVIDHVPGGFPPGSTFRVLDPITGNATEFFSALNPFVSFFIRLVSLFGFPGGPNIFGPEREGGGWGIGRDDRWRRAAEGREGREAGREGEEMFERPELGILLASMLLSQQPQGQTTTTPLNLQALLPLFLLGGGRGAGFLEALVLVSVLQSQAQTTTATTGSDGLATALLLSGFLFRPSEEGPFPWRRPPFPGGPFPWHAEGGPQPEQKREEGGERK